MSEPEIQQAIFEVLHRIAPEAELESLPPNEDLRQALDIDSLDFLNLLVGLHERLGVEIPEAHYGQFRTLRALVDYLAARGRSA